MREFYKPKYFITQELVHPDIFAKFGDKALMFLDPLLLKLADGIREFYGLPMTINNWHIGGPFYNRGLRLSNSETGAEFSAHKFGRAIDFDIKGHTADEIRKTILANQNIEPFILIRRMELGITWVHVDTFNVDQPNIFTFYP